jgi:hypothetical protein
MMERGFGGFPGAYGAKARLPCRRETGDGPKTTVSPVASRGRDVSSLRLPRPLLSSLSSSRSSSSRSSAEGPNLTVTTTMVTMTISTATRRDPIICGVCERGLCSRDCWSDTIYPTKNSIADVSQVTVNRMKTVIPRAGNQRPIWCHHLITVILSASTPINSSPGIA